MRVPLAGGFQERDPVEEANPLGLPDRDKGQDRPRDGRADVVIDAVGATATRRAALDLVRPGGVVVLLGLHEDESALPFHRVVRDQVSLQGSFAYTDADFTAALALLANGTVSIGDLPRALPLEAGPEAFARLADGPSAQ